MTTKMYLQGEKFKAGTTMVPHSCIESAECIIRSSVCKVLWDSDADEDISEHCVWMEFRNHRVNISNTVNIQNLRGLREVENYNFQSLPELGQGIGLMNITSKNTNYNMHFGAYVSTWGNNAIMISDVSEEEGDDMVPLKTKRIYHPDEFRGDDYADTDIFKIGLLTLTPDTRKTIIDK